MMSKRILWRKSQKTIILLIMSLSLIITGCEVPLDEVDDIDFTEVASGEYLGSHSAVQGDTELVYVEVAVQVEQPVVTDIVLLEHQCGLGTPAEVIIGNVLETQSLEVDAVSGATVSSNAILNAIEDALLQGLPQ